MNFLVTRILVRPPQSCNGKRSKLKNAPDGSWISIVEREGQGRATFSATLRTLHVVIAYIDLSHVLYVVTTITFATVVGHSQDYYSHCSQCSDNFCSDLCQINVCRFVSDKYVALSGNCLPSPRRHVGLGVKRCERDLSQSPLFHLPLFVLYSRSLPVSPFSESGRNGRMLCWVK